MYVNIIVFFQYRTLFRIGMYAAKLMGGLVQNQSLKGVHAFNLY